MCFSKWFHSKTKPIGEVVHYFDKIQVAVIKLSCGLQVGEKVKIKRGDEEFEEMVESMQINHVDVPDGKRGEEVAVKIKHHTKSGAKIFRV